MEEGEYKCVCIEGWAGSDCSIPLEMNCKDNKDNDDGEYFDFLARSVVKEPHWNFETFTKRASGRTHYPPPHFASLPNWRKFGICQSSVVAAEQMGGWFYFGESNRIQLKGCCGKCQSGTVPPVRETEPST